ncbi:hypothetical protein BDW74DRAFT_172763 [Aspergillus multicolor]|uniref:alpha/beta hydrolase n=1 Tax=Aspergillus multicolor TaxID=41759 RepID=UPI003CCD9DE4
MSTKPTLILAPGSWYPASAFDPLASLLNAQGYTTKSVSWPSVSERASSVTSLSEDIEALQALIKPEVEAGRDIVVIAHSWAGLPVNSGVGEFIKQQGSEKGGVVKLLFISAFVPEVGHSLVSTFGGEAEWYVKDESNKTIFPSTPLELFFHDVADGATWASKLRPAAWSTTIAPATDAAYLKLPSSYLLCEEDRAIPSFVQQMMIDKARENGADMKTEKVKTGHTPWLVEGMGAVVVDWIKRELEGVYFQ